MRFLVLYKTPVAVLDEWMQLDEATRTQQQNSLKAKWDTWMTANASALKETAGAGKTKLVSTGGISDTKNDVMLYSLVEAESHEAVAQMFAGHPHLEIPQSTIEIMVANTLPGMA